MNTSTFKITENGPDAGSAFLSASLADMASYPPENIGLKNSFRIVDAPDDEDPETTAQRLLSDPASDIASVIGHAGCIEMEGGRYLFFGCVSR